MSNRIFLPPSTFLPHDDATILQFQEKFFV